MDHEDFKLESILGVGLKKKIWQKKKDWKLFESGVGEENNLANFQHLTNLFLAGDRADADPNLSKKQRTRAKPSKSDIHWVKT